MTLKLIVALRSALLSQWVWATVSVSRVLILGKLRGFGACQLVSLFIVSSASSSSLQHPPHQTYIATKLQCNNYHVLHPHPQTQTSLFSNGMLISLCRFLLLWTSTNKLLTIFIFISTSFEAIASSSGGIQTLIDKYTKKYQNHNYRK